MSNLNFVGSPDFGPPASARHSSNGARRSRRGSAATSLDARLPIIEEDHPSPTLPPEEPPKTYHRPYYQRFRSNPPIYSDNKNSPPEYSFFNTVIGPKGEKFDDLRNNEFIAGRGGWKKICTIGFVLFLLVIGLVVGLAVGISKKHSSSSPSVSSNATAENNATTAKGPFPVGSWTFTTFLETASTNCTSNPQSWTCEPAQTYSQSPSGAQAIFQWIITDATPTGTNFSISSTNNPFSITFANTSLTLIDEGTSNERYTFKVSSVPKIVYPSPNVKCYYNSTTFAGDLYTKKPKSYPSGAGASASGTSAAPAAATSSSSSGSGSESSQPYADWGFAVDAAQSINGGVDVPDCYSWNNGIDGARVTHGYTVEPISNFCSCAYANYH